MLKRTLIYSFHFLYFLSCYAMLIVSVQLFFLKLAYMLGHWHEE